LSIIRRFPGHARGGELEDEMVGHVGRVWIRPSVRHEDQAWFDQLQPANNSPISANVRNLDRQDSRDRAYADRIEGPAAAFHRI
jgi:hypothetical protein